VLRCVYADLDAVLLGRGSSFLHAADGSFTLLGARALEACARAGAEVVPWSERAAADVAADAARLGLQAWIADGTLGLDDDTEPVADRAEGVARHLRARACEPADAIAVGDARELAPLVAALWLPAGAAAPPHRTRSGAAARRSGRSRRPPSATAAASRRAA
jgi:hypothetical protein